MLFSSSSTWYEKHLQIKLVDLSAVLEEMPIVQIPNAVPRVVFYVIAHVVVLAALLDTAYVAHLFHQVGCVRVYYIDPRFRSGPPFRAKLTS